MIVLLTLQENGWRPSLLDQMFRLRHRIFYDIRDIITVQDLLVTRLVDRVKSHRLQWRDKSHSLGDHPARAVMYDICSETLLRLRKSYDVTAPILHHFHVTDLELVA